MKAWRVYGIGDMRLDDIPVPELKPGWVHLKVKVVQPSITEIQQFTGTGVAGVNIGKMLEEKSPLQLFGHEFCGEVVEVGQGVDHLKVGDRVFWARSLPCHKCELCRAGHEEYCSTFTPVGMGIPGCFGLGTLQTNPLGMKGPSWNSLLPIDDKCLDAVSAGLECAPRGKVYRKEAR